MLKYKKQIKKKLQNFIKTKNQKIKKLPSQHFMQSTQFHDAVIFFNLTFLTLGVFYMFYFIY